MTATDGREVLAAPYAVYVAPAGTAFPAIDDAEADFDAAWVLLGTNGTKNYTEAGVVVNLNETTTDFTGAGSTRPLNAWRTAEGGTVGFSMADLSAEQIAMILDDAAVTTVAAGPGVAGEKSFSLDRGVQTYKYAVLTRGLSPESTLADNMFAQLEIPRAYQTANQQLTYTKGTPTEVPVEFTILENLAGGSSCEYRAGTTPAT
jgi:hypothetical protein